MTTADDLVRVFNRSSQQFSPRVLAALVATLPELPPAPAPCGPRAARQVAEALADAGAHSHLHAHGETVCLTGTCPTLPVLDGLLPTHTPREALL